MGCTAGEEMGMSLPQTLPACGPHTMGDRLGRQIGQRSSVQPMFQNIHSYRLAVTKHSRVATC